MTLTNEQIQALKAAAEKATPGEWWSDVVDSDSITTYAVYGPDNLTLLDMLNSDAGEIHEEYDDEYLSRWDETARRNADFIAKAHPEFILSLLADREADKALIAEQAKRIAELQSENAYIRNRHKELDLLIGKNILVMQAAIIEWQGTGDAKNGLAWIYNTLFGPGELPDEDEKDAQAYFDRKYGPLDEELMALHQWFWAQSEAERAAAGITLVAGGEDATD